MGMQAQGMMAALNGRRQGGGSFSYIDDSLAPESAANPLMQSMGVSKGSALGQRALPSMAGDAPMDPNSSFAQKQKRLAGMMVGQPNTPFKGMR
jgi:hypothetical protein